MQNNPGNSSNYTGFDLDEVIMNLTNGERSVRDLIDTIFLRSGRGRMTTVRDKQYSGFNHRQTVPNLPDSADHNGYCFFTRPTLNLSYQNALKNRYLSQLITHLESSIQMWVRMTLDHRLENDENLKCPLIDNNNVFIPLLSNSLKTLTGVPSLVAGTYASERGIHKEVFGFIDDNVINYESYTVTASFRNMNGNPFLLLFYSWILAASQQYLGKIVPYLEDLVENRINYTTRIYRIIMDHTKTYVTGIWAPVYAYPMTIETGAIFKYDVEQPLNRDMASLDVQFQCYGSIMNDDLLFHQFNQTVAMANPNMADKVRYNGSLKKLDSSEVDVLNYYGYPRINPETTELEWWVPTQIYNSAANILAQQYRWGDNNLTANQLLKQQRDRLVSPNEGFDDANYWSKR